MTVSELLRLLCLASLLFPNVAFLSSSKRCTWFSGHVSEDADTEEQCGDLAMPFDRVSAGRRDRWFRAAGERSSGAARSLCRCAWEDPDFGTNG